MYLKHAVWQKRSRWYNREKVLQRIVNQNEMVEFLKENPGATENQIQEEIYGYYRNESFESNKKYADCLRRALDSGKVFRMKMEVGNKMLYCYFAK